VGTEDNIFEPDPEWGIETHFGKLVFIDKKSKPRQVEGYFVPLLTASAEAKK
jgi:hypothetical protein